MFSTMRLPESFASVAQDGSAYDGLLGTAQVCLSDCRLAPGRVTRSVRHTAHDEVWFVRHGHGRVWRASGNDEHVVDAMPGTCLTIPAGTSFQFRTLGDDPFIFLIVQASPWPDDDERPAFEYVDGPWPPTPTD